MSTSVHQTLHGYSNGHRLLAWSIRLPSLDEEAMHVLSDLAGPRQPSGFDDYLTGYPLMGSEMYVFARTWLAYELPRPGCVWTHSLLIPFESLSDVDASQLLQQLQRPKGDASMYRHELHLSGKAGSSTLWRAPTAGLLHALYEHPDSSIWIIGATAAELEDEVVGVWTCQWPQLRRSFSFSTGSLGPRRAGHRLMDIQVVPASQRSAWLDIREAVSGPTPRPGARARAAASLLRDEREPYLSFLERFGTGDRAFFLPLTDVYLTLRRARASGRPEGLMQALQDSTLGRQTVSRLVKYLTGGDAGLGDYSALRLALEFHDRRPAKEATLSIRAGALAQRDTRAAWEIAALATRLDAADPIGLPVLRAIAPHFRPDEMVSEIGNWELAKRLISINPKLAATAELWRLSPTRQRDLLAVLPRDMKRDEVWAVLPAILGEASDDVLGEAVTRWPDLGVLALLELIDFGAKRSWPEGVQAALRRRSRDVVRWIRQHPNPSTRVLWLLVDVLPPDSLTDVPVRAWLPLLKADQRREGSQRARSTLLRIGLTSRDEGAAQLVSRGFASVHRAAGKRDYSSEAWRIIEPVLPSMGPFRDWDKCARLRRGLVDVWITRRWPASGLADAAGSRKVRKQLRRLIEKDDGGGTYREALRDV